jgi:hypothetical protein
MEIRILGPLARSLAGCCTFVAGVAAEVRQ